nr:sugar kinase [Chloroflexota bacterium]
MPGRDVIVLGDINADVLMPVPAYPAVGEEALTDQIIISAGGSAANTAVTLARFGLRTRLVGRVGRDAWAEAALTALTDAGVDTTAVQRDVEIGTGFTFISITPDGERTMFGYRGANTRTMASGIAEPLFVNAALLHLSGYAFMQAPQRQAAWRAIQLAETHGVPISLDTALSPALRLADEMRALLPRLTICVLGRSEAEALVGPGSPETAAAALRRAGVEIVGLKLGRDGCLLANESGTARLPAFGAQVVDTTGAGDAFSAGMALGYLRGWPLAATGTLATALGALAAAVWGGGAAMPGVSDVLAYLRAQASEPRIIEVLNALEAVMESV